MKTIDVIKVQGLMNQNKSGQVITLPGADRSRTHLNTCNLPWLTTNQKE